MMSSSLLAKLGLKASFLYWLATDGDAGKIGAVDLF
jgi:hypothetical protein